MTAIPKSLVASSTSRLVLIASLFTLVASGLSSVSLANPPDKFQPISCDSDALKIEGKSSPGSNLATLTATINDPNIVQFLASNGAPVQEDNTIVISHIRPESLGSPELRLPIFHGSFGRTQTGEWFVGHVERDGQGMKVRLETPATTRYGCSDGDELETFYDGSKLCQGVRAVTAPNGGTNISKISYAPFVLGTSPYQEVANWYFQSCQ